MTDYKNKFRRKPPAFDITRMVNKQDWRGAVLIVLALFSAYALADYVVRIEIPASVVMLDGVGNAVEVEGVLKIDGLIMPIDGGVMPKQEVNRGR